MLHYFLGGSVMRGLYKDLIWLLNTNTLIDYGVTDIAMNFYIHLNIHLLNVLIFISIDSGDQGRG